MDHQEYLDTLSRISERFANPAKNDIRLVLRHLVHWHTCPECLAEAGQMSLACAESEFLFCYHLVYSNSKIDDIKSDLDKIAFILDYKSAYHELEQIALVSVSQAEASSGFFA